VIELFRPVAEACLVEVPATERRPIAVVGGGAIMDLAHLPAYRRGGLQIVGTTDIDQDRARAVAGRHGIERVYPDRGGLLADDDVEVVDVAVPAQAQPGIARQVLASGRHMLGQKPFALSSATASELADLAEDNHVVLAVNQHLRFDEGVAAAHRIMELGWLGEVTNLAVQVDIWGAGRVRGGLPAREPGGRADGRAPVRGAEKQGRTRLRGGRGLPGHRLHPPSGVPRVLPLHHPARHRRALASWKGLCPSVTRWRRGLCVQVSRSVNAAP
jgi:hypothetical protein